MNTKKCLICKKQIITAYTQTKVCGKQCKLIFRRQKKEPKIKKCTVCENNFQAISNLRVCSDKCKTITLEINKTKKHTLKKCYICKNTFNAIGNNLTCSKECSRKQINARINNRYKNDINFKLSDILRSRLRKALKNNQKGGSAVDDLGCTIDEFKSHIESQFQENMTWDNHNLKGWHIDHIVALANFDLSKRKELLKACHYTNLQPLWAKDNQSKGKNND